ncbi:beta strand repeat-containing protein [Aliarcobacter butzleri]|uniref:beta strand repeat-containing protein n=1 Tax=Aliarcobacter butzleri TaxID=28197 RepID=UPI002B244D85|nr:hypothetical protein [Aliarcobacter butzleri]
MALKSIKVTTSQIADAITDGDIGIETSVTITDNLYTAADLLSIIAETNKTITLVYTAAGTPIADTTENLLKILAQVNKYTGPLTANGTSTAEELNYIAKKATGKVTAELVDTTPITKATVDALKDVSSSDNITFAPTPGTVSGKAALEALVALGKKLPNTDWTGVTDFEGTASEVAAIKAALKVVEDANVTITSGQISAADANALVVASNGDVTATIKDGSVAATLKALKDVDGDAGANILTFKSTDKTADAKALVDLADLVTEDFSSVLTITSKAADIGTNGANVTNALTLGTVGDPAVTITNGTISAANAAAISNVTTGKVTATITPDTADVIAAALNTAAATDALSITVNGATALAADLNTIDGKTALKVKVDAATVTAANFDAFEDIYVTGKNNFSNLGDENITVTTGVNSAQADIVAKATSKVVTATINGETAASVVTNLKNANAKDAFTITLTNAATSAKDLLTLDGKTSKTVDASAIVAAITGTVAEVNKLLDADVSLAPNAAFTLSGTVKAADANYIALNTTGVVKATIAADTAAKLDAALTDVIAHNNQYTLTVNGATASVTELNALAAKTAVAADAIKVDAKEITGTGAELVTLYGNAKFANLGNENVKITDAASLLANINSVLDETTGVVTASATNTAAALVTGLTNAKATDKLTLTVSNDAAATNAADLLTLDGFTSVKVDATGITNGITGTAAQLKQLVAAKGVEIAKGVDITVTGAPNASDLATILKSTLGTVTATNVTADTAAKLNAALKDANSSDALTLTVNDTTATAKDLISLDGKTSVDIVLNVGAITGNIAEITKVFVTDAANFDDVTDVAATISGTITAAQAETIADITNKTVTATIAADTAANLNAALLDTDVNAYKLTIKGDYTNSANAADLVALDARTSVTVNAAAIKNIEGNGATGAADVKEAYEANAFKTISGLGNETVDLSGATDANASLVKAINDYTTGVITLPTITFVNTAATTFDLKQLGDLNGITGLANINADNGQSDTITISLKDLLAANDSKGNFTFNLNLNTGDAVSIANDVSGWTKAEITLDTKYTYTNDKTGQVVTIVADEAVINA